MWQWSLQAIYWWNLSGSAQLPALFGGNATNFQSASVISRISACLCPASFWWDFPVPLPGVVLFRMSLATLVAPSFVPSRTFSPLTSLRSYDLWCVESAARNIDANVFIMVTMSTRRMVVRRATRVPGLRVAPKPFFLWEVVAPFFLWLLHFFCFWLLHSVFFFFLLRVLFYMFCKCFSHFCMICISALN